MQFIFLSILGFLARTIIQVKKPYIIGVTGTVGKTTITSHIATYLTHEFGKENVRISPYHYNGEFGLPLSIIGAKTGGKNPFLWILVFFRAFATFFVQYPKYLILEYGIDHPGEMTFLLSIARPDIGIISPVAPNHLEQFGTLERYRNEKLLLVKAAHHVIAYESLRQYVDRDAMFYSMGGMSDIDASHMHMSIDGVRADVHLKEIQYHIHVPAFGAYQIENILPLYGIAHILGIDPLHIAGCSQDFLPEAGRSSILKGKGESVIIDGSYNGGYESICRGIDSVLPFATTHRIVFFLGDMRELGEHAESIHSSLASYIGEKVDDMRDIEFFLVGPNMGKYVLPILQDKYRVIHGFSSRILGRKIADIFIKKNEKPTIIYVKGSQNTIFLEEGIIQFLAHSDDAKKLCRQNSEWKKKKDIFFQTVEKNNNR